MKKHGFVKVLKLNQLNLDKDRKVINVKEENITKLSSYNFLVKTLETYNKKKFENDELITEFIKINLPTEEDDAKKQWFEGVVYEGHIYKAWFATTGGMKKEGNGICDTIFIREDYKEFGELVENLISLGKFSEIEKEEKIICINKDVLSRLSLITSDLIAEIDMPNFIVLPQATFEWVKDYKTVEPFKYTETKERELKSGKIKVTEKEHIDYNLIDVHFDDKLDIFDGGGIATPQVFNKIGNTIGRQDVDFAIIRAYSIGIKGLITKFNIIKYLDIFYKEDTAYCRKIDGQYQLLDRWNDWQTVTDNTIILNDSMVKLAKYFNNMQEYKTLLNKLNNDEYRPYYDLLTKLYITKVNKNDEEISDYRRSNYQLMNALALTVEDYKQLIKQDFTAFKKILKPFNCIKGEKDSKEFIANIDYINLFYKQCVNVSEDDENFKEEATEKLNSVVDKVSELININQEFVKLDYVKRNLRRLIEKKCRELAAGKVTIKAKCQYIAVDPISYMNYAMYREQKENGLQERQFYSSDCENKDIRTITRNPLSAYSEVHNVEFVRNVFFDNWLCKSKELIYFNQKSDIYSLLSSADSDGDFVTVIDEPIIRDAVVIPKDGKYFITKNDGTKKELAYNKENRFQSTYQAAGNLIGKIALKAANVNCNCQKIPSYYDTIQKIFISKKEFKKKFETEEEFEEFKKEKLESKEWIFAQYANEELREYMKSKFYEYEKEIYIILYNSMCAIDAPKTLVFPPKENMEILNEKYFKKVRFLQYKENRQDVKSNQYICTYSLLDYFSEHVQENLLDVIEGNENSKQKFSDRSDILQRQLKNEIYCEETYGLCYKEIQKIYEDYTNERKRAEKTEKDKNKELWKNRNFELEQSETWDDWREEEYLASREKNKQEKYKEYKEIDKKYIPIAQVILKTFDIDTISEAISNLEKCTENFILTLFFKCLKNKGTRYVYRESEDGDIEYLYRKYKKIEVNNFDNTKNVESIVQDDKLRLKLEQKIRFKMLDASIIDEIQREVQNGTYNLKLSDKRVQAFEEFNEVLKNKEIVKIIKFDTKKNGEPSISKSSFGVITEV